jgi:hypothetical protein
MLGREKIMSVIASLQAKMRTATQTGQALRQDTD